MGRFIELVGGDKVDVDQQWRILDIMYDVKPLRIATAAIVMASLIGWLHGLVVWSIAWAASALVVLAARSVLSRIYRARSRQVSQQTWKKGFMVASIVTGVQWGIGGLAFLQTDDIAVMCVMFGVETAIMTGASARTSCFPAATILQVMMTAIAMALCSLLAGQWVFVGLLTVYVAYQISFINGLATMNLRSILSEQENKILLTSLAIRNEEIGAANARLQEISMTDSLTGISNRRCFDRDLSIFWSQALRQNTSIALLFIDVDHFKQFNDAHGHPAGDSCLCLVATAMTAAVRQRADRTYRYGGEEFAVLLVDTDAAEAYRVAGRVAESVRSISPPVPDGHSVRVTVSIGIAALVPEHDMKSCTLLALADQAVYVAKQDGRNCIRTGGRTINTPIIDSAGAPLVPAPDDKLSGLVTVT